jgi:hypothetical protein
MSKEAFEFLRYTVLAGRGYKIRRSKNLPLAPQWIPIEYLVRPFLACGEDDEIHTQTRL